jgi:hypothetical protein
MRRALRTNHRPLAPDHAVALEVNVEAASYLIGIQRNRFAALNGGMQHRRRWQAVVGGADLRTKLTKLEKLFEGSTMD